MEREQKILVVEDMAPVAAVIREALEGEGVEVECVSSAERAFCALATAPAMLITDIELPGASGLESPDGDAPPLA